MQTLYEKLIYHPEKFSFVKAVDVAIASCGSKFVEIKSKINFVSKFGDIFEVEGLKDGIAEIYVNLGGIAGIEGTLPDCYVEEFITFNKKSRKAISDFFDIFNGRMLFLRYSHMKRQKVESLSSPIEKSVIGNIIFSLAGFDFNEQSMSDSNFSKSNLLIPEQFKISSQNLFWKNARSASGLKALLSSFFKVPIEIEQFRGGFIKLTSEETSKIGTKNYRLNKLGQDCFLGSKVWDASKGINIKIGPLSYSEYCKFLPKHSGMDQRFSPMQKMKEIIKMYLPYGLEVNLHFFLDVCKVKETVLNGINRLNKDAFIFGIHSSRNAYFNERI